MKRFSVLLASLLIGLSFKVTASHELGGELTYQRISAYAYQVKFTQFRDCQGAQPPVTFLLNLKAPGCNTSRNVTLQQVGREMGKPYGAASPQTCTGSALPLFELVTFAAQVNFSAAEFKCRDWVLSVSTTDRTPAENIVISSGNANFYTEAHLKLLPNVVNNSPVFNPVNSPLLYVNYVTDYNLSVAATDPEGDSLVYSLVAPLAFANTPVAYGNIFSQSQQIPGLPPNVLVNPNPRPPYSMVPYQPQFALFQNFPGTFSPDFPVFSIKINWNEPPTIPFPAAPVQPAVWEVLPYFNLHPNQGVLQFNVSAYNNGAPANVRVNRYLVSILVEEYRKINGVATKLGSIRRETLIQVFYYNLNLDPKHVPVSGNPPAQFRTASHPGLADASPGGADLKAFPNPFTDALTFSFNLKTRAERILIFNVLGKPVDQIELSLPGTGPQKVAWINAGKFPGGTYVAKLVAADKTIQTITFTRLP